MTPALRITVVAMAAAAVAAVATAQQRGQTTPTPRATPAPVVLIGCVERVMPASPTGTPAAAPPAYKIMDVQPGTGAGQKPMTPAAEYLLAGPESIAFSKYQNQWVEVTGTIAAAPPTPAPSARGQKPAALPTFTVTALKVVSTECK